MNEKDKSISEAMKLVAKKYGQGSILKMDETNEITVKSIPTGLWALDNVFGCGGLPRGRIIEVFGQESSGKSSLALFIVSQVQKAGGRAVWIDAEYAFSTDYARGLGVDVEELIVSQPSTGEEALDIVGTMAATHGVDIIVLDSVAALVPEKELEGEIGDASMAQQARMMSKAMRMLTASISQTNTAVIFINQTREKIGVFFGNKETTSGGKALKFFASVRIEVKKGEKMKDKAGVVIGNKVKICAVKNKVGFPWKTGEFDIIFGKGVEMERSLLESAEAEGVIVKTGNTYKFNDKSMGVGQKDATQFLVDNPDIFKEINDILYGKNKRTPTDEGKKDKKKD